MAQPDPYQRWYGAPKHWMQIPAQRQAPPAPPSGPPAGTPTAVRVAVALLGVGVGLLLALSPGGPSVADLDGPRGQLSGIVP